MGSWPSSENIRYVDDSYEIVDRKYHQTYAEVVKRRKPQPPAQPVAEYVTAAS